jgi:ankyrin repeat protein
MSFGLGRAPPVAVFTTPIDTSTPWITASDGNLDLLQMSLTQLQLTPDTAVDENGYTLLQAAASYSQVKVMEWLVVAQNVTINAVDREGDSALHYAATVSAATFLLNIAKINPNLKNQAGKTALESKQEELNEMMQDEDNDDEDNDFVNLRAVVDYLRKIDDSMKLEQ